MLFTIRATIRADTGAGADVNSLQAQSQAQARGTWHVTRGTWHVACEHRAAGIASAWRKGTATKRRATTLGGGPSSGLRVQRAGARVCV
jgi:hypothetical protein